MYLAFLDLALDWRSLAHNVFLLRLCCLVVRGHCRQHHRESQNEGPAPPPSTCTASRTIVPLIGRSPGCAADRHPRVPTGAWQYSEVSQAVDLSGFRRRGDRSVPASHSSSEGALCRVQEPAIDGNL